MSDSFDRLLAHSQRQPGPPPGPCPEPGVLAAYLDGTLARSERTTLESHAADCARCALQLATVVRLEDESGHPQHPPAPSWWRRMAWMVSAATAVVVAAVYFAVPWSAAPPSPAVEGAPSATSPAATGSAVLEEPAPSTPLTSASSGAGADARADVAAPVGQRARSLPELEKPTTPSAAVAGGAPPSHSKAESVSAERETRTPQPAAVSPPMADTQVSGGALAVGAPAPARNAAVSLRVAEPEVQGLGPLSVQSPDGLVQWRVAGSRVERSTNAGRTWSPERAPGATGITLGAAPSTTVCWLASPSGRVLRRNEAGEWDDVSPVPTVALSRVQTATARGVTFLAQDGSLVTTADAGRSWTRHAPP